MKIKVPSFRSIKNFEFDIKKGVTLIQGRNGAGKSNLLTSILAGLFGVVPVRNKQVPKIEYGDYDIIIEGDGFEIHRSKNDFRCWVDNEEILGTTITERNNQFLKQLGFSDYRNSHVLSDITQRMYFYPDSKSIFSLPDNEKTKFILDLFGLGKLDDIYKELKSRLAENRKVLGVVEEFNEEIIDTKEIEEKINTLETKLKDIDSPSTLSYLKRQREELESNREVEGLKKQLDEKLLEIDKMVATDKTEEELIGELSIRLSERDDLIKSLNNINQQLESHYKCPKCFVDLQIKDSQIQIFNVEELKEHKLDLSVKLDRCEFRIEEIRELKAYKNLLWEIGKLENKISQLTENNSIKLVELGEKIQTIQQHTDDFELLDSFRFELYHAEEQNKKTLANKEKNVKLKSVQRENADLEFLVNDGLKGIRNILIKEKSEWLEGVINKMGQEVGLDGPVRFIPKLKDDFVDRIDVKQWNNNRLTTELGINESERRLINIVIGLAVSIYYPSKLNESLNLFLFDDVSQGLDENRIKNFCNFLNGLDCKIVIADSNPLLKKYLNTNEIINLEMKNGVTVRS